jgi:nucleoside-diphosphate-sugar epimerase
VTTRTSSLIGYTAHILEQLLQKGHEVVTTVRSEEKASKIRENYSQYKDKLDVQIVPDIAKLDAFDEVVKTPGIEVVLHTASPFHFNFSE